MLITPTNLQYILGLSISSRLLVIFIQVLANHIISDHDANAYRNRYHEALLESKMQQALPVSYRYIYRCIEGFTKWDAQYFLEISMDGYVSEQHLAFLPLYPIVVSAIKQSLFGHTRINFDKILQPFTSAHPAIPEAPGVNAIEDYIRASLVGVTLNNFILFPVAAILLFGLTKLVKNGDDKYARSAVWWFCYNPASVFFSACYSESLYAVLTFMVMLIIEYRAQNYLEDHQNTFKRTKRFVGFDPLSQLNRLIYIILPALIPMALAGAARSNGLVNIGFIIFQLLIKYAPIVFTNRSLWYWLSYLSVALELMQDVLVLVMSSVLAASGYISFQIYSFIRFCSSEQQKMKGFIQPKPFWCNNPIPHPYGQVQAKYWNVGLFRYYEIKQLPNFLLAIPISFITIFGSLGSARELMKKPAGSQKQQLAYYAQAIIMTLLCSISINIQVITRLLASSCPVVYWICADIIKASERNSIKKKILQLYFLGYLLIGTILHTNFYPWT